MIVRTLDTRDPGFEAEFARLVVVDSAVDKSIERAADAIVDDVRERGDAAVLEYTNRFDRMSVAAVADLEIAQEDMRAAFDGLPAEQRAALRGGRRAHPRLSSRPARAPDARRLDDAGGRRHGDSASESRRWTASACMCRAARRPIRRRC